MSRRNRAETLKGGILLMGILMILLLVSGGILKYFVGDRPEGPVYKVEVKLPPPAGRNSTDTQSPDGMTFQIPVGSVDVAPPERIAREELADMADISSRRFLEAGLQMRECRRFARKETPGDAVSACAWLMESAVAALAAHSAARPYPDTLDVPGIDRGYITPDGFNAVKGRACFEIRRANAGDSTRQLAMEFISGLATQDFGPGVGSLLDFLPTRTRVAGTERIVTSDLAAAQDGDVLVWADYMPGRQVVSAGVTNAGSAAEAAGLADAAVAELAGRGAVRKTVTGGPDGTFFFIEGQFPVAVGSSGSLFFRIEGHGGITDVASLASIFARQGRLPEDPR